MSYLRRGYRVEAALFDGDPSSISALNLDYQRVYRCVDKPKQLYVLSDHIMIDGKLIGPGTYVVIKPDDSFLTMSQDDFQAEFSIEE